MGKPHLTWLKPNPARNPPSQHLVLVERGLMLNAVTQVGGPCQAREDPNFPPPFQLSCLDDRDSSYLDQSRGVCCVARIKC